MQLGDLFTDATLDLVSASTEVLSVEVDSRRCSFGTLFFALSSDADEALRFSRDAVDRGAVAVATSHPLSLAVPVIVMEPPRLRRVCTATSSQITGHPERGIHLVGVTGTNGKTTVTSLVSHICQRSGRAGGVIGTLTGERTTPAAPEFFRALRQRCTEFGPDSADATVAIEVSSHALDQERLVGVHFDVVAFTNLSHDHLDYHGSMEKYFAAKARLFTRDYAEKAVIWTDSPYGERLAAQSDLLVSRVNRSDAGDVSGTLGGTAFFWRGHLINSPLVGEYNVENALMAMAICSELGVATASIAHAMSTVPPVPGRFNVMPGDVTVVVDYAHTPQGLERLLRDVRRLSTGRIVCVFGCGGDRDRAKRPVMGQVASSLSDITIVTSDNPRSEDPDAIIEEIVSGVEVAAVVERIIDRREAIERAVSVAHRGDVVVIAGKGHERTQIIGTQELPFNDRDVVAEIVRAH